MKILPAVVFFLICFFSSQSSYSSGYCCSNSMPVEDSVMQDTIIARNPHFIVRPYTIPHYEMQDTVIARVEHIRSQECLCCKRFPGCNNGLYPGY